MKLTAPKLPPIQPTGWQHYLKWSTYQVPARLRRYFFLSWEDALWELQRYFQLPAGSRILVPSFFCGDVIQNMHAHGFQVESYPLDRQWQITQTEFRSCIRRTHPTIIVFFHPVGSTSPLLTHPEQWLDLVGPETILLEDAVHRVVEPNRLRLLSPRHVVIDSLRKTTPLAGANLFTHSSLQLPFTPWWQTWQYQLAVLSWWWLFQLCLQLQTWFSFAAWSNWWNHAAEKAMLTGYDLIGDSQRPARSGGLLARLARHVDHQKIEAAKERQVAIYEAALAPIWQSAPVFRFPLASSEAPLLRGYPLGLELETAAAIVQQLRQAGVVVRCELNDSQWSSQQKVVYLPLGPHLSAAQVNWIGSLVARVVAKV